jgi:predicted CXXCH cytochrome family protein
MSASRDFRPSTSFVAAILLLAALFCAAVLAAAPGMGAAPAWALSTVVVSTPADGAVLVGTTADITGMASGDQDLTSVEVSTDGGATWALAAIESGGGTTSLVWRYAWTLPAEDSSTDHVILARVTDTDGSVDTSSFNPIVRVDTLAPAVTTFFVNGDAAFTGSTEATLTIEAFDGSPPMAMQFSNDGTAWGDWWPYGTSATWTLASGDGLKVVRARFRDAWGNVTPGSISDTISLNSVGPAITGRSPAHGAAGVGTATFVQAAFSTSMDPVSLSGATVQLWLDGDGNGLLDPAGGLDTQVTGSVSYDDRTRTVIVRPGSLLVANSTYFFRLTAEVSDLAGLTLGTDSVTSFTTGVSSPLQPGISAITPTDGSAGVPVTSFVTIVFDREMDPAGIEAGISLVVTTSGAQVAGAVVLDPLDARVVHFYPAETLDVDTGYTVTVSGTLQDYFGETLGSDIVVAFSTGATGFNPHGTFNAGSSVCAICHSVHDAAAPSFFGGPLLRSDSEAALCYTCHDGSGATTDVRAVFESMGSGHVLEDAFPGPGAGLTTRCSSCHDPHADGVNRPKRRRARCGPPTATPRPGPIRGPRPTTIPSGTPTTR